MQLNTLLKNIAESKMLFNEVLAYIDNSYSYSGSAFKNGSLYNKEGENIGSCKVLFFAKLNGLNKDEALSCFCEHYKNVLENPDAEDHQNIRNFMKYGLDGLEFEKTPLAKD